jgi:sugar phosphate permease
MSSVPPFQQGAPAQPAIKPFIDDSAAMRMLLPIGRSGLAIAAGYLGLFAIILIPAPIALAVGIAAILHLRSHPEKHGMGRAVFGTVMGLAGTIGLIYFAMK